MSERSFHEAQFLPLRRTAVALAIPPCGMLGLLIWQVVLKHPWGNHPLSNGSLIGWTVFLWLLYLRLITVRLTTDVRGSDLIVALRGFWRKRRVPLAEIRSAEVISVDPERDYGGYGFRSTSRADAYLAGGGRGVRLKLTNGATVVVGSGKPEQLAEVLSGRPRKA